MDNLNPLGTAPTRVAIEFLTLWLEPGGDARHAAAEHIAEVLLTEDSNTIMAGLLNLSMLLVLSLSQALGAETPEEIDQRAREILRAWSIRLPERPS